MVCYIMLYYVICYHAIHYYIILHYFLLHVFVKVYEHYRKLRSPVESASENIRSSQLLPLLHSTYSGWRPSLANLTTTVACYYSKTHHRHSEHPFTMIKHHIYLFPSTASLPLMLVLNLVLLCL